MSIKTFNTTINRIFFKALGAEDKFGNLFKLSIQLGDEEGTWINLGGKKKDRFTIKQGNSFVDIGEGTEVFIKATGREYNDKTYYDAKLGDITFINIVEASAAPAAKAASSIPKKDAGGPVNDGGKKPLAAASGGYKKDNTGMEVGHALNSAVIALKAIGMAIDDPTIMLEAAKLFHDATTKLKAEHKENNPSLSDYDVGASAGMAVKFAAELFQEGDGVERILELARWMLNDVSPVLTDYVKNGGVKEKKAPAKKEPAKKAEKKEAPIPADDLDDDVPF